MTPSGHGSVMAVSTSAVFQAVTTGSGFGVSFNKLLVLLCYKGF